MSVLSRIFPPPTYITMPCVGVDISDTSLKYISFKPITHMGVERELLLWGDISIPSGVVERGEVQDLKKLTAVLKEFKTITGAEYINVSLPEERAYLFETEIRRSTPTKEIRGLLEFRLEENVPIPSKDVSFDYIILPNSIENKSAQVAVSAYARETIQQYYSACIEAEITPVSFEVEAQAMARATVPDVYKGAVMMVDFGKTRTGIGIVYDGVLLYTSTINIGGDVLSQALRKAMGPDIAEEELTKFKNQQGLIKGIDSAEVHNTLISTVSVIKDELVTRMQYWHIRNNNNEDRRIKSIVICGGSANLKGLPAYLTETIGIPCTLGNVWTNAFSLEDNIPPIDRRHSLGYATAIGLALKNNL